MSIDIPRILLIDDDVALLACLSELLRHHLYAAKVVVLASSDDVVAKVNAEAYDVVVCDLKMPHQDGLAVIRQVKTANLGQRILLITDCIDESIGQEAHQEGADAVLRKPLDRDEVASVLRSLIELSHTATKLDTQDGTALPAASM